MFRLLPLVIDTVPLLNTLLHHHQCHRLSTVLIGHHCQGKKDKMLFIFFAPINQLSLYQFRNSRTATAVARAAAEALTSPPSSTSHRERRAHTASTDDWSIGMQFIFMLFYLLFVCLSFQYKKKLMLIMI